VDEDRGVTGNHMVCVDVVDREVVRHGPATGAPVDAIHRKASAGTCLQQVATIQLLRLLPLLVGLIPEGVILGGGDGAAVGHLETGYLVFVDPEVGDPSGALFTGFGIGGED